MSFSGNFNYVSVSSVCSLELINKIRNVFATYTAYPSEELENLAVQIYMEEVQAVKNVTGLTTQLIVEPIPIKAIQTSSARGGNALGLSNADGALVGKYQLDPSSTQPEESNLLTTSREVTLVTAAWNLTTDDAVSEEFANKVIDRITAAAKDIGVLHPYLYINYCSEKQDPFTGYGEVNKARLQSIQKAVDPTGIFTSTGLNRGSFKLW